MSVEYEIAPIFMIRMAGVPFESIEALSTPQSISAARTVIGHREHRIKAAGDVEEFFNSRKQLLSPEAYHSLRVAVRTNRAPVRVKGTQPAFFTSYASSATAVESAERELDLTLAREVECARAALLQNSRKFLGDYIVFATPGVRDFLIEHLADLPSAGKDLAPRNNPARKIEQSLLLYLQRVAAKNDTFSRFGPTGWGKVDSIAPPIAVNPASGVAAREVFLERWTAHAMAAAINADPDVFAELCPRRNPNGRIENQTFVDAQTGQALPLSREEITIVERCDGAVPVHAFGNKIDALRDLVRRSVLRCVLEVPALEPHALEILTDRVRQWRQGASRNKWLSILEPLTAFPSEFREADTAQERIEILDRARSELGKIGAGGQRGERFLYSATNPIGEECVREINFRIQSELLNEVTRDAAMWIDLWRDCYAFVASRVAQGLRRIFEKSAPGADAIPLPAFLRMCEAAKLSLTGPGLVAMAVMAFQEVKAAVRERLLPHLNDDEYELTLDDCHIVRQRFEYPKFDAYTYPSADLQLAAESVDAVARGQYQWIVGELHPPIALLHHGFYWGCPDKKQLNEAFARVVAAQPNFHFGFFAADFTSHTSVRIFDALPELSHFVAPQIANPKWKKIEPGDAEVFIQTESGDIAVRKVGSREYLGSFARAWIIPLGFHPFQFGFAPGTPRLRCGGVIVQRRSWTVSQDEFPAGAYHGLSRELVIAIEQLRADRSLPRYIYIRPSEQALRRSGAEGRDKDTKPVFIDLESYLFQEVFYRWLTKAGELELTEMLPDPDHLLWAEPEGRRTFELRTLIVPRESKTHEPLE